MVEFSVSGVKVGSGVAVGYGVASAVVSTGTVVSGSSVVLLPQEANDKTLIVINDNMIFLFIILQSATIFTDLEHYSTKQ